MNSYKTDTNGALANTTPLFSSSWLALFYVLRENFYQRRIVAEAIEHSQTPEK